MSCRIHENPLGDEGIEELVSKLLALHEATTFVEPDTMTDRLENENIVTNEHEPAADNTMSNQSSGDHVILNNTVNGDCTIQTSCIDSPLALKSLEIGACGITTAGAHAVAKLIRANIGITSLSFTGNKEIEADGWAEIADSLEHNTVINTLELHHNALQNSLTSLVADGLTRNTSIHTVDLEGNHIEDEGAEKIQKMLQVNRTLQTIHLRSGNRITDSVLADIEHLTAKGQHLPSAT